MGLDGLGNVRISNDYARHGCRVGAFLMAANVGGGFSNETTRLRASPLACQFDRQLG